MLNSCLSQDDPSLYFFLNGKESLTAGVVYKQKKDGKTQQE
jgi:hypothetical protein